MVMEIENRSAFESVSVSAISITFMIMSIISCMSRELALVWMDGKVFNKKVHLNCALSFSGSWQLNAWLAFVSDERKLETKRCFFKSS